MTRTVRWLRLGFLAALAATAVACVAGAPARWAEGGAPLLLPNATWERGRNDPIVIRPDGAVLEDGDVLFTIDRAGRVFDEDNEPLALLNADGGISGPDDVYLGRVGMHNASPPWATTAWLRVRRDGKVAFYDADGEAQYGGSWSGCAAPFTRTCTLVTHLLALRASRRYQESPLQFGIGIGMIY